MKAAIYAAFSKKGVILKKIALLVTATLLASCATPAERRSQAPDIDIDSSKSAKDVATCISEKWENTRPVLAFSSPPVNTNLRANGFSITATNINHFGSTNTLVLADVTETKTGTKTKYYKTASGGFGDYDTAVRQCQ